MMPYLAAFFAFLAGLFLGAMISLCAAISVWCELDSETSVFGRMADALDAVVDRKKKTLRTVDVERGSVYKTHLGEKLSGKDNKRGQS